MLYDKLYRMVYADGISLRSYFTLCNFLLKFVCVPGYIIAMKHRSN